LSAEVIIAIGSLLIALVSLLALARQTRLQTEGLKVQMDEDILAWAQEAIDVLSEGVALVSGRAKVFSADEVRTGAHDIGHRLSGLADRGRLFFPNEQIGDYGADKESAFRGVRPPIVDAIVFASCAMLSVDADSEGLDVAASEILLNARRLVVSEAQNAVDPRRKKEIVKAVKKGREDDNRPVEDVVGELHAALAKRLPDSPVVTEWAKSRAEAKRRAEARD